MKNLIRKNRNRTHLCLERHEDNAGFTAVELLIAMAVFSFVLTLSTIGFIQINQLYQQGVATRQVQDATRYLQADITRTLRESDYIRAETRPAGDVVCSDRHRYFVEETGDEGYGVLYKQHIREGGEDEDSNIEGSCLPDDGVLSVNDNTEQVTDDETVVIDFEADTFNELEDESGYYSAQIRLRVATAATQDVLGDDDQCDPSDPGAHFCAVSEQFLTVTTRSSM